MAHPAAAPARARRSANRGAVAAARTRRKARRHAARANPTPTGGGGGGGSGSRIAHALAPIGIGALAYAGTRFVQRAAWTITVKRRPRWAKHVHALAGVLAFGATYFAASRVKALAHHAESAMIGSGVAAIQGVVTAYVPRFGWVLSDPRTSELAAGDQQAPGGGQQEVSGDYLEQQLAAYESPKGRKGKRVAGALETAAAAAGDQGIDPSLLEELGDESVDDLYGGVFEDPTLNL